MGVRLFRPLFVVVLGSVSCLAQAALPSAPTRGMTAALPVHQQATEHNLVSQSAQSVHTPVPASMSSAEVAPVLPSLSEMKTMPPEVLEVRGDALRLRKDFLSAVDCYDAAISKGATAMLYNKLAMAYLLMIRPADAERAAKAAVKRDKQYAEAWNNLGVAEYMQKKYGSAVKHYSKAIALRPLSASFHSNLGAALMDNKKFDRGIEEYRKAFELDPTIFEHNSANAVTARMPSPQDRARYDYVMARLFASSGDLEKALHYLRKAMEDGYPKIDDVYRDHDFATVVKDERFIALMKDRPAPITQ